MDWFSVSMAVHIVLLVLKNWPEHDDNIEGTERNFFFGSDDEVTMAIVLGSKRVVKWSVPSYEMRAFKSRGQMILKTEFK